MRCWDIPAALYAMFICAILGWSTPGQAHSWYPHECCSDRDCSAVEPTTIKETAEGFRGATLSSAARSARARMARTTSAATRPAS
jgi:hypothetical protein